MNLRSYEVDMVNPKTNDEITMTLMMTDEKSEGLMLSDDWIKTLQDMAVPLCPSDFMPILGRVRQVARKHTRFPPVLIS